MFSFPGVYAVAVHIAEHGDDLGKWFLHSVIVLVDCCPYVPTDKELVGFVSVSIEHEWRVSFEGAIRRIDDVNPLRFLLGLVSSNINFFLLSFHCSWMIWGVGAGRKLLKCCGNCCNSKRDAGLLFVEYVVRMLGVQYNPPANV